MSLDTRDAESIDTPEVRLLRLRDVADRCNVSLRTVEGWVAAGWIHVLRLPRRAVRVTEEALAEFLEQSGRTAP